MEVWNIFFQSFITELLKSQTYVAYIVIKEVLKLWQDDYLISQKFTE